MRRSTPALGAAAEGPLAKIPPEEEEEEALQAEEVLQAEEEVLRVQGNSKESWTLMG